MKLNYRLLTVLLFALAVSICAGSFFEVLMTGEGKQQIENILGSLLNAESDDVMGLSSFGSCFLRIFVKNALMLLLAYLSPALLITMPILPATTKPRASVASLSGQCFFREKKTPGRTPLAPAVGAATIRPMAALHSPTAMA